MTHVEVQGLERAWHTSRSDADGARWLRARERAGDLPPNAAAALAMLEFGPAMEMLGRAAPPPSSVHLEQGADRQLSRSWRLLLGAAAALPAPWLREASVLALARLSSALPAGVAAFVAWAEEPPPRPALDLSGLAPVDVMQADALVAAFSAREDAPTEAPPFLIALHRLLAGPADPWSRLRRDLLHATLGPLPGWAHAPRRVDRLRLALARDASVRPEVLEAAAAWLRDATPPERVPGLEVRVVPGPLPRGAAGADEDALRAACDQVRAAATPGPREAVVVASASDGPDGYVARHHPRDPEAVAVWLDDFVRVRLRAPIDLLLGHLALKKALEARLRGTLGGEPPRRDPDVGCLFDLCAQKVRLDARIRTGALCARCSELVRGERARLSREVIAAVEAALEAGRRRLLGRGATAGG